jgi:hypothetical protein
MPPHIVSMDSNSLMNPYRDAGLWQRSAIIDMCCCIGCLLAGRDSLACIPFHEHRQLE